MADVYSVYNMCQGTVLNDLYRSRNLILIAIHDAGIIICRTLQVNRLGNLPEVTLMRSCGGGIRYRCSHSRTYVLKLNCLYTYMYLRLSTA